jgi:alkyl hydroperoxide reductase subunit AhpC
MESHLAFCPKDFTFVCPTEIVGLQSSAGLRGSDAVLLAGSTDNEFVKLAWRRRRRTSTASTTGNSPTATVRWSINGVRDAR